MQTNLRLNRINQNTSCDNSRLEIKSIPNV